MIEYNGAWIPDWLRITGVPKFETMEDRLVERGYEKSVIATWESKSVANKASKPVALTDSRKTLISVYQSVVQCERDIGMNIDKYIEYKLPIKKGVYVIKITRTEFNDALQCGVPLSARTLFYDKNKDDSSDNS